MKGLPIGIPSLKKLLKETKNFSLFKGLAGGGFKVILEDFTLEGKIDMPLFVEDKVYLFKFKVDRGEPLFQIYAKNYAGKYSDRPRIYAIGFLFDSEIRNLKELKIEQIK